MPSDLNLIASKADAGDNVQFPLLIAAVLGTTQVFDLPFSSRALAQTTAAEQTAPWRLVFEDNFEGDTLALDRWTQCYWWDKGGCTNLGNQELQWYLPGNISVSEGALRLKARPETILREEGTYEYSSGIVTTGHEVHGTLKPSKFEFQYGYAEVRARVPEGQGLWPAFWLLPSNQRSLPEIDVMEVLGHEPDVLHFNFHFKDDIGRRRKDGEQISTPNLSDDWHVYAVDWSPERIIWYFDGVEQWRYEEAAHVPHEPMYLILNLAVGGEWAGPPDDTTQLPADLTVDYVRVWQRAQQ